MLHEIYLLGDGGTAYARNLNLIVEIQDGLPQSHNPLFFITAPSVISLVCVCVFCVCVDREIDIERG